MQKLFDIFPKPQEVYEKWVHICATGSGFDCLVCPYGKIVREDACFEVCMKGDFALWMKSYDMSKPLIRRYIGSYEWDKETDETCKSH